MKREKSVITVLFYLDIDECVEFLACHQNCTNIPGSFVCGCFENFILSMDSVTCERELLLFLQWCLLYVYMLGALLSCLLFTFDIIW